MRPIYPTFNYRLSRLLAIFVVALILTFLASSMRAQQAPAAQASPDQLDFNDLKAMLGERDTALAVQNKTIDRLLKENAELKKKAEACATTESE